MNTSSVSVAAFRLILLPGMLGTENLFQPFIDVLPAEQKYQVVAYPTDRPLSYTELFNEIKTELSDQDELQDNLVVLGESFAGPLALMLAAALPGKVRAVVMSASFVRPPLPRWIRRLAFTAVFRVPLPAFLIRFVAAGPNASADFLEQVRRALRMPTPEVLAFRAGDALSADTSTALIDCPVPILYLSPTHDHLILGFNLKRILALRPDVVVQKLLGPHLILQARPAEAWQAIRDFTTGAMSGKT